MTQPGVPRFLANTITDQMLGPALGLGQRVSTFRYEVSDGLTGIRIGDVTPLRTTIPVMVHNTQNTIMRTLTGLNFGAVDTAAMNPITDRISVFMMMSNVDGTTSEYPLGRYMYSATNSQILTGGDLAQNSLFDEMFIVDQQMETPFSITVISGPDAETVDSAIRRLLFPLVSKGLITYTIESSDVPAVGAWPAGTSRAKVLSDLCTQGQFFQPWFSNTGPMKIIRSFNPALRLPDFDFDESGVVHRDTISYTNDFLEAPNRYVVINNSGTTTTGTEISAVGSYQVPNSAPWSIANRGFAIPQVEVLQAESTVTLSRVAETIAQQNIIFERTQMSTSPDPRHDSYDVIRWQDGQWMEIAYSFQLQEGSPTIRTLRKAYS